MACLKISRPAAIYVALIVTVIVLGSALSYRAGLSATQTTTTVTETSTTTTSITSTNTVFRTINGTTATASGRETRLIFLGENTFVIRTVTESGALLENFYRYTKFPYSNVTFDGFEFRYLKGEECKDSPKKTLILPCGSRILVDFPSYGVQEIPTGTDNPPVTQEYFQWITVALSVINGHRETAGLLLTISEDGSRTVYVITQR